MSIKDKTILVVVGIILSLSSFFLYIGHKQIADNLEWKIKKEELINKSHHNLVHYRHADGSKFPENECPIYMACRDGMVHFSSDDLFWRKDGSNFKVEYISTPIKEDGKLTGAVVVFRDLELYSDFLSEGDD